MTSLFEDHLSLDAVVAFADGEMSLTAFQRAAAHVARCQACATEVSEQTSARQQLRTAPCPRIPSGLLDALRSIPVAVPAAPPAPGLSRDEVTGRASRTDPTGRASRTEPAGRAPRSSGRTAGDLPGMPPRHHSARNRGFRLGAGAIVAGLAVGAIAATAINDRSATPTDPPTSPDAAQVSYPVQAPRVGAVTVADRSAR